MNNQRCLICNRKLTNPVSKKYGYGPECIKKAVVERSAPLVALVEMDRILKATRIRKVRIADPEQVETMDLFGGVDETGIQANQ